MLRRLDWIRDCGIFEDFRWDSTLPDLGRINVIYGPNGTGKTSLAGALDGLRNAEDGAGFSRLSITLDDDGTLRTTSGQDDAMFDRIHVFSEHYVARSHRFTAAEPNMAAVLTIGEKPVETEKRLEELRASETSKSAERKTASNNEQTARQAVDVECGQIASKVVAAASRAGGRWRSRGSFSAGTVKTAFEGSHANWALLSDDELQAKIGLINTDNAEAIDDANLVVSAPSDTHERLSVALGITPSTIVLDTLAAHPEATSWVDGGRHLHDGVDTCIFCGSPLTADRRALIDQHFSVAVQQLQETLRVVIAELANVDAFTSTALAALPSKGLFFEDLRPRYDEAAQTLREELQALRQWAGDTRARAEQKAANVLVTVDSEVREPPAVAGSALNALRAEHNERVAQHDQLVQSAAQAVESHYLKEAEGRVEMSAEKAASEHETVMRLDGELTDIRSEITTLATVDGDPLPSAKVLTTEVARLLGRNELQFEAVDGAYRVARDGQPAVGLSMGERTAITLIHFLEMVARFDAANGKPIVVIDDPVSSLDSDIFMGVSTYIWSEAVAKNHIAQLILLTHNFELFRQWDVQIEGLPGSGSAKSAFPSLAYELRSSHVSVAGRPRRRPQLIAWPPSAVVRKKMRSSYQHGFMVVSQALLDLQADDSMERRLDAQLLFPNVIRRMLESFLAFKRPEWVGDFSGAMRNSTALLKASNYDGDADALRLRLTRYSNAHSHNESPSTDVTVSPDEVMTAIQAVFEFMNCLDHDHFQGLCEVAGVDSARLLPPPPIHPEQSAAS